MSKTIWVVERTDNAGEFQPVPQTCSNDQNWVRQQCKMLHEQERIANGRAKFRAMQYVRREVRS
jgi:hypothetical protein